MRRILLALLAALLPSLPARAAPCERPTAARSLLHYANLKPDEVRITFIGHATFTLESPSGVLAATDYNDHVRPRDVPTIATMNHAHSTHFSYAPDPGIRHVLRGWAQASGPPKHDVQEGDMRVRNVPTNIRDGGFTEYSGNSIFVFEVGELCIAHLGHLHHVLTDEHLKALGQIDILMAPVDGSYTLDAEGMMEVIRQISPRVVIPMHWFRAYNLEAFLSRMESRFSVERRPEASGVFSRANLPRNPAIIVLGAP